MDQHIEHLIKLLEQTEFLYRSLLPIIEEEQTAAIKSDIDRLTAASCEKQSIIDQTKRLDEQLKVLARQVAAHYQVPAQGITLTVLAAVIESPYAEKLRLLNDKLKDVVHKVQASNEQCSSLMRHCSRLVQSTLGYFQHWMSGSDVYGSTGNMRNNSNVGRHFMSGTV